MEYFDGLLPEFLKGANLVWIIGIVSGISSALWASRKFFYEKQLERFKDANINLFKTNKQEVLAAIATLGVFNRDRKFKQNTIDILLSRLYTELDYDVTNAIASALIQYSNRRELKYIADELAGINRNFFLQTYPIRQMISDLKKNWTSFKEMERADFRASEPAAGAGDAETKPPLEVEKLPPAETDNLETTPLPEAEKGWDIERDNLIEIKEKLLNEFQRMYPKDLYELVWHKQITGDTYSRIMRKASRESRLTGRQKRLEMRLYQNDFNYTHLAKINTSKCSIENTAISTAILSDVVFSNIKFIKDTTFSSSSFRNCTFEDGRIVGSSFIGCTFKNVVFRRISFEETFLCGSYFSNCRFIECENTNPEFFFGSDLLDTEMPFTNEVFQALTPADAQRALDNCKAIFDLRREEIQGWLDTYYPIPTGS